jgi:hypothetical protein
MGKPLLIQFQETDSIMGSRRETLKKLAEHLGVTETRAVHIAINRLYRDLFHPQETDFPTEQQIQAAQARHTVLNDPVVSSKTLEALLG